jgi:hypothetical protein
MRRAAAACGLAILVLAPTLVEASEAPHEGRVRTNATYYNDAALVGADPYVLHDRASGYYYAYSTEGADPGYYFAVYRSADLVTWEQLPGGALPVDDPNQWGNDWFWAPEVYHNPKTGLYYLFYSARSDPNSEAWFGYPYPSFEEPCKIGVAVSRSPAGPFRNITDRPLDWNPYDPDYHDVNLIMGPDQKKPPETREEGETAPLGTYIPTIDADVFFDDGRVYLYASRNAYRNWVWDPELGKYIEESNIIAVPLTRAWWNDPTGSTMPTIARSFRGANDGPGGPSGPRRDGFVTILTYGDDPQSWENSHVNDYEESNGERKDRRWEEGSSILEHRYRTPDGRHRTVYYLTYSANNWESSQYGVGYAVSDDPLGPFTKYSGNPILSQDESLGMYSTGHGSIAFSPDGTQLYYVHHGRPDPTEGRRLYTERMHLDAGPSGPGGVPTLRIDQATGDRPIPSGVAPYRLRPSEWVVVVRRGSGEQVDWQVTNADDAALALGNPLNRVRAAVADPAVATIESSDADSATVVGRRVGYTRLELTYQRQLSTGEYEDTYNLWPGRRQPVSAIVHVIVLP